MMDMKEEMMSDAVDDVMDEEEDEEEEGDKILKEVLDEIGVGLSQQVSAIIYHCPRIVLIALLKLTDAPTGLAKLSSELSSRQPVALGDGPTPHTPRSGDDKPSNGSGSGGAALSDEDALQARLDALRRG